jgi:hypothetical protein
MTDVPVEGCARLGPCPARPRAAAPIGEVEDPQLRHRLPPGESVDWSTFTVTGPAQARDAYGNTWYEYCAEVTANPR